MHFDIDNSGAIVCGNFKFRPWPDCSRLGASDGGERPPDYLLWMILWTDDLFCWAWRAHIPVPIFKVLVGFPDGHPALIELAQADPEAFLRMSNDNPALLRALAAGAGARGEQCLTQPASRAPLLRAKHHDVLGALGWRGSRSLVRLLRKVPFACCRLYLIRGLLSATSDPRVLKILRHLPVINDEVIHLLAIPGASGDFHIINLAASEPGRGRFRVRGMVSMVYHARQDLGLNPWPFRAAIRSWEALIRLVYRTELQRYGFSGPIPEPPISAVGEAVPDGLHLVALDSARLLQEEGLTMDNCIFDYTESILLGGHYAYRIMAPERGTMLLSRDGRGHWQIDQALTAANEQEVSPETRRLLETWLRGSRRLCESARS